MLIGQEIGFLEVVWISLFGMIVTTIAVILMMIFIIVMGNIISKSAKKKSQQIAPAQALGDSIITDLEAAAITTAVIAETERIASISTVKNQ